MNNRGIFRDVPIRRKLMMILMLTSGVALLLACTAFVVSDQVESRREKVRGLTILAELVGKNSAAALTFNDPKAAQEILVGLEVQQNVVYGSIYARNAQVFAQYARGNVALSFPDEPLKNQSYFAGNSLHVVREIILDQETIGAVHLVSDMSELESRLKRYAAIVGLILVLSSLVALVLSSRLQRLISDPILDLARLANMVSKEKNYSIRAVPQSHDEIGVLIGGFNEMLEQIQQRTQQAIAEHEALRDSEERFRTLTEKSTDLVLIAGLDHLLNYVSPSAVKVLGYDTLWLVGTNLLDLVHASDRDALASWLDNSQPGHEPEPMEFRIRRQDGSWVWMESALRNLLTDPKIGGLVINARNVGERKEAERELTYRAFHDTLTQLPNRALFTNRVEAAVNRARRHPGIMAAVLFMDIDDFKVINDSLGHDSGDEFIREIGRRLMTCLRTSDTVGRAEQEQRLEETVARMGGDEFTVLLEDIVDPTDALRVADRIQSALAQSFFLAGQDVYKSASIGIALTTGEGTAEELLRNADIAMYRAKRLGGARSEMFDTAMHLQVMDRLKLESDLRRALERHEFRLQYQPIVSLESGRVTELEALLRWERPGVGLVYPLDFLPVAEESGLIRSIGKWVLREACSKLQEWNAMRPDEPPISMAVNVSGKQFNTPGFVEIVADVLRQTGIQPSNLHLEITESVAMEDAERTRKMITDLKNLGVQLMLDDFGTGYSSMSYLRRFEVDTLKIDRSFVSNVNTNRENRAIVNTIIKLAAALQIKVIAEGVETAPELDELRQSGCLLAQGWLFAKSLDEDAVVQLLSSKDGFQNVLMEYQS